MNVEINRTRKQSNYDISLKALGGLDSIVDLCKNNNISDINSSSESKITYNNSFILNKLIAGKNYATGTEIGSVFSTEFDNVFS